MKRRQFLAQATAVVGAAKLLQAQSPSQSLNLNVCTIVLAPSVTNRERRAVAIFVEEVEKRSTLQWPVEAARPVGARVCIYAHTDAHANPSSEGYTISTGSDAQGDWITVTGASSRGLLYGLGKLLRSIVFGMETASVSTHRLNFSTTPKYPLRGHQLGYRPKTNAYDAWTVPVWDQYIRELALFGTNAVELVPPRTDDMAVSPHFPLPPQRMMTEMSRIADSYDMDVWIWFPAMDADYRNPETVASSLKEWATVVKALPRVDAVFVPGGDPGETAPRILLDLLQKQKENIRQFHPKAQMWISPQSFNREWMDEFFTAVSESATEAWLDGVVTGPQIRMDGKEFRKRLPARYPIRLYPDITHSVECQLPIPDWDFAFAMTEGREVINPRPAGEANILRRTGPGSIGFISYSEGCNDDLNKFIWSQMAWDPGMPVMEALREYCRAFGTELFVEGWARGLLNLELNWTGPLATNAGVDQTLAQFQDMERAAPPALLENWRFQQALYRAYYDAFVRSRLLAETAHLKKALEILETLNDVGWAPLPSDIDEPQRSAPAHLLNPDIFLEEAERILASSITSPAGRGLRDRVRQLGEALFQSIRMQLAMERYQAEAVSRAANLDTLDYAVTDVGWLRGRIADIRKLHVAGKQVEAVQTLLRRTDPGPGGFYDELGNPANRPHLLRPLPVAEDPEFRVNPFTGFDYPDEQGDTAPIAWKRWSESLFEAPLRLQYLDLDSTAHYRVRVVYAGDETKKKIRLTANEDLEIHPFTVRPWPPSPLEFDIPQSATANGQLILSWTQEPGQGGNGRGCQVSEVWLMLKKPAL